MSEPHKRRYRYRLLVPLLIVVLLGVVVWFFGVFLLYRDCGWHASAEAWVDENANGIWDDGELPLEGVEFHVDDIRNNYDDVGYPSVSDWNGRATTSVWLPGCPRARFKVYTVPPPGYRSTTDARLPAEGIGYGDSGPFRFGFALLPGFPTPTPYTRGLTCEVYDQEARDIGIGPDGSVWAASWDGVSQYNPANDAWHSFEVNVPDIPYSFDDIVVGSDGVIWIIASDRLMARFAESNWTTYTEETKLIPGSDPSVGRTPDGTVWFVLGEELVGFNPQSDSWKLYCTESSRHCNTAYTARAITDGAVWFVSSGGRSEYGPPDEAGSVQWEVSDGHTFAADEIIEMPITGRIRDAEIAPDGTLWIVHSYGSITSLNVQTEQWQTWDSNTTHGLLFAPIQDLAVAPDGSIWLASSRAGHALAYRFIPEYEGSEQDAWRTFDPRDGIPDFPEIDHVAIGNDGAVWFGFAHEDTIARCELIEQ